MSSVAYDVCTPCSINKRGNFYFPKIDYPRPLWRKFWPGARIRLILKEKERDKERKSIVSFTRIKIKIKKITQDRSSPENSSPWIIIYQLVNDTRASMWTNEGVRAFQGSESIGGRKKKSIVSSSASNLYGATVDPYVRRCIVHDRWYFCPVDRGRGNSGNYMGGKIWRPIHPCNVAN